MTAIHVYCSYRLSPVGYQYGVLRCPASGNGNAGNLSPPEKNSVTDFVTKAFDHGFITGVSGKIPVSDSSRYILLVKKRHYSYPEGHQDIGKDVMLNLAFEFDDFDEFRRFATAFETANSENASLLDQRMADLILPDYNAPTYGLKIHSEKLNAFVEKMKTGQPAPKTEELRDNTEISVLSASKDYNSELERLFHLQPDRLSRNNKTYMYGKKKAGKPPHLPLLPIFLIIMALLALLVFLTTRSQATALLEGMTTIQEVELPTAQEETEEISERRIQNPLRTNSSTSQKMEAREKPTEMITS